MYINIINNVVYIYIYIYIYNNYLIHYYIYYISKVSYVEGKLSIVRKYV